MSFGIIKWRASFDLGYSYRELAKAVEREFDEALKRARQYAMKRFRELRSKEGTDGTNTTGEDHRSA